MAELYERRERKRVELEIAERRQPHNSTIKFALATLIKLHYPKEYGKAITKFQEALQYCTREGSIEILNEYALLLKSKGRYAEAMDMLKEAIARNPRYGRARKNLGLLYKEMNDIDGALRLLVETIVNDCNDAHAWYLLGKMLKEKDDDTPLPDLITSIMPVGAIRSGAFSYSLTSLYAFERCVGVDDFNTGGFLELGHHFASQRNYTLACCMYQKVLDLDSNDFYAITSLGDLYCNVFDDFAMAAQFYLRALPLVRNKLQRDMYLTKLRSIGADVDQTLYPVIVSRDNRRTVARRMQLLASCNDCSDEFQTEPISTPIRCDLGHIMTRRRHKWSANPNSWACDICNFCISSLSARRDGVICCGREECSLDICSRCIKRWDEQFISVSPDIFQDSTFHDGYQILVSVLHDRGLLSNSSLPSFVAKKCIGFRDIQLNSVVIIAQSFRIKLPCFQLISHSLYSCQLEEPTFLVPCTFYSATEAGSPLAIVYGYDDNFVSLDKLLENRGPKRLGSMPFMRGLHEADVRLIIKQILIAVDQYYKQFSQSPGQLRLSSIFVNEDYTQAKLSLFGIPRTIMFGPCSGGLLYAPPDICASMDHSEELEKLSLLGEQALDMWQIGCIWGTLLTGELPWTKFYDGDSDSLDAANDLAYAPRDDGYTMKSSRPEKLITLLLRMRGDLPFNVDLLSLFTSEQAIFLLNRLLDKSVRPTIRDLLMHPYFADEYSNALPSPEISLESIPLYHLRTKISRAELLSCSTTTETAVNLIQFFHGITSNAHIFNVSIQWLVVGRSLDMNSRCSLLLPSSLCSSYPVEVECTSTSRSVLVGKLDCFRNCLRNLGGDIQCLQKAFPSQPKPIRTSTGNLAADQVWLTVRFESHLEIEAFFFSVRLIDDADSAVSTNDIHRVPIADICWDDKCLAVDVRLHVDITKSISLLMWAQRAWMHESIVRVIASKILSHLERLHEQKLGYSGHLNPLHIFASIELGEMQYAPLARLNDFNIELSFPASGLPRSDGESTYFAYDSDANNYTQATDVYLFAVCLLLLLSKGKLIVRSDASDFSLPTFISPMLSSIISSCLRLDPIDRPTVASLMAHVYFDGIFRRSPSDEGFTNYESMGMEPLPNFFHRQQSGISPELLPDSGGVGAPLMRQISIRSFQRESQRLRELKALADSQREANERRRRELVPWLLKDDGITRVVVHVEGLGDIHFYSAAATLLNIEMKQNMDFTVHDVRFFSASSKSEMIFFLEKDSDGPEETIRFLERYGSLDVLTAETKRKFLFIRDNDLKVVTKAKFHGSFTQSYRQQDFSARQYHHRLRWGRAIENYLWPFVLPAFVWKNNVKQAYIQTVSTFATVAKNFFPRQSEEGLGWLGYKRPGGQKQTAIDFAEQILKRIVVSDGELAMTTIFIRIMLLGKQISSFSPGNYSNADDLLGPYLTQLSAAIGAHSLLCRSGEQPTPKCENRYGVPFFDACGTETKGFLVDHLPRLLCYASSSLIVHIESCNRTGDSVSGVPNQIVYFSRWILLRFQEEFWNISIMESLSDCAPTILTGDVAKRLFKLSTQGSFEFVDLCWNCADSRNATTTIDNLAFTTTNGIHSSSVDAGVTSSECPGLLVSIFSDESSKPEVVENSLASWLCLGCGKSVALHDNLFNVKFAPQGSSGNPTEIVSFFSALCVTGSYGWDSHAVMQFIHQEDSLGKASCNSTEDLFELHAKHFSAWLPESASAWLPADEPITRQSSRASTSSAEATSGPTRSHGICTYCDDVASTGGRFLRNLQHEDCSVYDTVRQIGRRMMDLRRTELNQISGVMNIAMSATKPPTKLPKGGANGRNKKKH